MSDKSYTFAMKALSERFKNVNVRDKLQAVKLVYDADIAAGDKSDAFLIYRTSLQCLPGMPKVLTECEKKMKSLSKADSPDTWESIAAKERENTLGMLAIKIQKYQNELADLQVEIEQLEEKSKKLTAEEREERGLPPMDEDHPTMVKLAKLNDKADTVSCHIREMGLRQLELQPNRPYTDEEEALARAFEKRLLSKTKPVDSWPGVLKAVLGAIFKLSADEFTDKRILTEFEALCSQRKEQCSMITGPLQFAITLNEEVKLLNWGLTLVGPNKELRNHMVQGFEYDCQQRFLHSGDTRQFNWKPVPRHLALGCMEKLVEHLKEDIAGYGSQAHEVVAMVHRASAKDKAFKIIRQTVKSGNYEESLEEREPRDEDEPPAPKKPKTKAAAVEPADALVAAVRPVPTPHDSFMEEALKRMEAMSKTVQEVGKSVEKSIAQGFSKLKSEAAVEEKEEKEEKEPRWRRRDSYNNNNNKRDRGHNGNNRRGGFNRGRNNYNNNRRNNHRHNDEDDDDERVAAVASSSNRSDGQRCCFKPCYAPRCERTHEPGQYTPNPEKWKLYSALRRRDYCPQSHESGICRMPSCNYKHGTYNEDGARCDVVEQNAICENFFSSRGCRKSHKIA